MPFLLRLGALCGALSGLFIAVPGAVEAFTGETAATSLVLGVSPALAPPLLTALHVGQSRRAGRLGEVGYAVNVIGLGLFGGAAFTLNMVLFFLDDVVLAPSTRLAFLASALVFIVGVVLFGASMIRARVYPAVPVWAYVLAMPVFALAARLPDTVLTSALHVVVGGSLVWLALAVRGSQAIVESTDRPGGH